MAVQNKVLTVGAYHNPPKGGIAQVLYNYENLVFSRHTFRFLANSEFNKNCHFLDLIHQVIAAIKYFFLIFDWRIKLVHVHTASSLSFVRSSYYIILAHILRRKTIVHVHGGGFKDYYEQHSRFVDYVFSKCNLIIVLTEKWRDIFVKEMHCTNVEVVNNVVDCPKVILDKSESYPVHVLFLGFLQKEKGVLDLVETVGEHVDDFRGRMMLHVAGIGMEADAIKNIIARNKLDDVVKLEGWIAGSEKAELMQTSRIFVLPSYVEGLPMSILECMAAGMAIISTHVGDIGSIVNSSNGILITPGDKDALHHALISLINDFNQLKKMGEQSREKVVSYNPESIYHRLENIYENLLKD